MLEFFATSWAGSTGSSVYGIFHTRVLEWVIFLDPGIELESPVLQADSLPLSHWGSPCFLTYVLKGIHFLPLPAL